MTTISIIHFDMFFQFFKRMLLFHKNRIIVFFCFYKKMLFSFVKYIIFIQTIFVLITFLFRFDNYFNFIVIISTNWTNIFSSIFPSIFTMFCKSNKILPILFIKKMKNHFLYFEKHQKDILLLLFKSDLSIPFFRLSEHYFHSKIKDDVFVVLYQRHNRYPNQQQNSEEK